MLKLVLDSADKIPEGFATAYQEKDGKFHLKLDDSVVPKTQLDEFRNNNIDLLKKTEDLTAQLGKFDGVDMDAYQKALKEQQQLDDKTLIDAGKVDELVEKRVERMKADFEGKSKALGLRVDELSTANLTLTGQLSNVLIDSEIQKAVSSVGKVRDGAMQDILNRGRSLFKLIDNKPVPIGVDKNPIFGKDGKAPMTFLEWGTDLLDKAPYLFETASGGGSQGGRTHHPSSEIVAAGDPVAFGRNLEDIASGKAVVQ